MVFACYGTIALGTLFGGWRIVKTMGMRITKLKPVSGFCAETGGAITLFLATGLGVPVSTTHTITGAIVGVGSVQKLSAVRWGVAGNIVWAWIFTIPCSAFVAAVAWGDRPPLLLKRFKIELVVPPRDSIVGSMVGDSPQPLPMRRRRLRNPHWNFSGPGYQARSNTRPGRAPVGLPSRHRPERR